VQGFVSPHDHDALEQQSDEGDRFCMVYKHECWNPGMSGNRPIATRKGDASVGWSRTVGPAADRFGRIQGCSTRGELA
jgi:hypothetical protein